MYLEIIYQNVYVENALMELQQKSRFSAIWPTGSGVFYIHLAFNTIMYLSTNPIDPILYENKQIKINRSR